MRPLGDARQKSEYAGASNLGSPPIQHSMPSAAGLGAISFLVGTQKGGHPVCLTTLALSISKNSARPNSRKSPSRAYPTMQEPRGILGAASAGRFATSSAHLRSPLAIHCVSSDDLSIGNGLPG